MSLIDKQNRSLAGVVIAAWMLVSGASRAAEQYSENLLENGDFEQKLEHWTLSPAYETAAVKTVSGVLSGHVHAGQHALRIRNRGGWSDVYHSKRLPLGGNVYEISFWARAGDPIPDGESNPVASRVYMNMYVYGNYDLSGPTIFLLKKHRLRPKTVDQQWRRFVVGFWCQNSPSYREFAVALGTQGDVILDDAVLRVRESEVRRAPDRVMQSLYNSERFDSSHVSRIGRELETTHLRFCRPSATGPVKALFLSPLQLSGACRDVIEMDQRFDVDFSAVTLYYPWTFAYAQPEVFGDFQGVTPAEKTVEVRQQMAKGPEVIVLPNLTYACLPGAVQNQIKDRVTQGAGLVVISPRKLPADFQPEPLAGAREEILAGVPFISAVEPSCRTMSGVASGTIFPVPTSFTKRGIARHPCES